MEEYTKERLERMLKDMDPKFIGSVAKNFRKEMLRESVTKFSKKTDLSETSIYNFEKGSNSSYITFYEYVKRGFLNYMFG